MKEFIRNPDELNKHLKGRIFTVDEIDTYMEDSGFDSILPLSEDELKETELLFYSINTDHQINIFVKPTAENKWFVTDVELT